MSLTSGKVRSAVALVVVAGASGLAASSAAAAYWDYQGNLPKADGTLIYVKNTNVGMFDDQPIRMSWTGGTHCMRFLRIHYGSWYAPQVCGFDSLQCPYAFYDCRTTITSFDPTDKFGCYNPPGQSTVWVNCRATNPL
jgi:hypothetical protein